MQGLRESASLSRSRWARRQPLWALSEACVHFQERVTIECLTVAASSPRLEPVAFIHRAAYDETPMLLRVQYRQEAGADTMVGDSTSRELSKVFVVEGSWAALFKKSGPPDKELLPENFLVLQSGHSPELRCANSTTATAVLQILASAFDATAKMRQIFPLCIRLSETDAAPALIKAEHLLSLACKGSTAERAPVHLLHCLCNAHRLHRAAQLAWSREQAIISGITRLSLVMGWAGAMSKLHKAIEKIVEQRLVIVQCRPLSREAQQYRETLIPLFLFPASMPRRHSQMEVLLSTVLNGDFRKTSSIEHICGVGCCESPAAARQKVEGALKVLFRMLRPGIFARNDWACWSDSWRFITFGSGVHQILPPVFELAFNQSDDAEEGAEAQAQLPANPLVQQDGAEAAGADAGVQAALQQLTGAEVDNIAATRSLTRLQRAAHLQGALTFLHGSEQWWKRYLLLRRVLQGEVNLMAKLLHSISSVAKLQAQKEGLETGTWHSFLQQAHSGNFTREFFDHFTAQLLSDRGWECLGFQETEAFRSSLLSSSALIASVVWEKVKQPLSLYPWRLWRLVCGPAVQEAREVLAAASCIRGDFVNGLLEVYNTEEKLASTEFRQLLQVISASFSHVHLHSLRLVAASRWHLGPLFPDTSSLVICVPSQEKRPQWQCFPNHAGAQNTVTKKGQNDAVLPL